MPKPLQTDLPENVFCFPPFGLRIPAKQTLELRRTRQRTGKYILDDGHTVDKIELLIHQCFGNWQRPYRVIGFSLVVGTLERAAGPIDVLFLKEGAVVDRPGGHRLAEDMSQTSVAPAAAGRAWYSVP